MSRNRRTALGGTGAAASAGGRGGLLTRPLLVSAAGHVLALSACLVLGAGGRPEARLAPAVEVLLVAADTGPAGGHPSGKAPAGRPRAAAALPGRAGEVDEPAARPFERPAPASPPLQPPAAPVPAAPRPADPGPGGAARATPGPAIRPAERAAFAAAGGIPGGPGASRPAPDAGSVFAGLAPAGGTPGRARVADDAGGGGRGAGSGLLRERIQSRIVYPEEAIRRGLEGDVLLRIHVETGGVPNEIRIARSSGARLLDDAARRGVVNAAPLPSDPGWVEVPVRFRLR